MEKKDEKKDIVIDLNKNVDSSKSDFSKFLQEIKSDEKLGKSSPEPLPKQEPNEKKEDKKDDVLIVCRSCGQTKHKDEFKAKNSYKLLKTCKSCREKSIIKNPNDLKKKLQVENDDKNDDDDKMKFFKDLYEKNTKKEQDLGTFDRDAVMKNLKQMGVKDIDENISDEDLKKKREATFIKIANNFDPSEMVFNMIKCGGYLVEQTSPFTLLYGVDFTGLVKEIDKQKEILVQTLKEIIKDNPEILKKLTPTTRLWITLGICTGTTIVKNISEKKNVPIVLQKP